MVRRGLVASREQALAAVTGGRVLVGGAPAEKAARLVAPGDAIVLQGPAPRFVSRGGEKLAAALDHFQIDVAGRRALDAGASTGGFTDCLLQRGAATVTAVDVGRGQLHQRLLADARVRSLERTNIRSLSLEAAGGAAFDVVVADLSFISLANRRRRPPRAAGRSGRRRRAADQAAVRGRPSRRCQPAEGSSATRRSGPTCSRRSAARLSVTEPP